MAFTFHCQSCGGGLSVVDDAVGAQVACPHCGATVVVPEPGDVVVGGSASAASVAQKPEVSSLAVGSLVASGSAVLMLMVMGCFAPPLMVAGGVVGIIMGRKARREIAKSQGRLGGDGLAQAGLIVGIVAVVLGALFLIFGGALVATWVGLMTTVAGQGGMVDQLSHTEAVLYALDDYASDHGSFPQDLRHLVDHGYLAVPSGLSPPGCAEDYVYLGGGVDPSATPRKIILYAPESGAFGMTAVGRARGDARQRAEMMTKGDLRRELRRQGVPPEKLP